MARKHYTALGEQIDMAALAAKHSSTVALGNARMNARGDILGNKGVVLRTQEQIEQEWKRAKEAREASVGTSITPDIKAPLPEDENGKMLAEDQDFDPSEEPTAILPENDVSVTGRAPQSARRRKIVDTDQ